MNRKEELVVLINHEIKELDLTRFSKFDAEKVDRMLDKITHYLVEYDDLIKALNEEQRR